MSILVDATTIADLTGLGLSTIYQLARDGDMPCVLVGRRVLFRVTSIEEWAANREPPAPTPPRAVRGVRGQGWRGDVPEMARDMASRSAR